MAYNNYYPATYQPIMYPQYQTPQYQPQYQNAQYQTQTGVIWVSGDEEADAYPVAPNNAVRLWHKTLPIVYFKEADASGKPTVTAYDLVKRSEGVSIQNVEYAPKSDFDALCKAVEGFKGELETIKGDIYGIAGKRKKKEVTEDE